MNRNIFHIFVFSLTFHNYFSESLPVEHADISFDYLLLDQHWPITECDHWKVLNNSHFCSLPSDQNAFSVHGLWPTKTGTSGPNSCSSQPKFDRKDLDPILNRLKQRWMNIHGGTDDYSFWAHEWNKHGTCAKILQPFNSVLKYFQSTLQLNLVYDIFGALMEYGISPGDSYYAVDDILSAVVKKFGKTPQIYCTFSKGEALLHSVKLCFDKNIQLIDCSSVGINPRNCGGKKSLKFPKKVSERW